MTELEKLLDKIYWHADAQGTAQAQILSAFAEKDKKIAELESENLSLRHDKAIVDNYVKELEAQVEKAVAIYKENISKEIQNHINEANVEKLAGNVVKEAYSNGAATGLRISLCIIDEATKLGTPNLPEDYCIFNW